MTERVPGEASSSIFGGWVEETDGYFTPKNYSPLPTTKEFQEFSEASRARWNLVGYVKTVLQQKLRQKP